MSDRGIAQVNIDQKILNEENLQKLKKLNNPQFFPHADY